MRTAVAPLRRCVCLNVLPLLALSRSRALSPPCRRLRFAREAHDVALGQRRPQPHRPPTAAVVEPTIYALSTPPGKGAIAIIRISGSACRHVHDALCPTAAPPKPRYATLRKLYAPHVPPSPTTLLDSGALVLYFPAPQTVTGEDVLELHVHGGPAVVRAVLAAIPTCIQNLPLIEGLAPPSIRYAEPGEFTRRAFANNRLDLPQIESLGETLAATTEEQRKLSVRGTASSLAARYEHWRYLLLQARGELEALIDFSEDQHFDESPATLCTSVAVQVDSLRSHMSTHVANAVRGELLRSGISIALLGAPNAGKSSLLNCIVGRDAAIVSDEAGTTRDVVEVGVDLRGWLIRLGDMAGLRKAGLVGNHVGPVELEGIKRAKQRALESDVLIVVQDATADMDPEVTETATQCAGHGVNVVVVVNKIDQLPPSDQAIASWKDKVQSTLAIPDERLFFISCKDGNIQSFLDGLVETFKAMTTALVPDSEPDPSLWQESLGATERQRLLLSECLSHLEMFQAAVGTAASVDAASAHALDTGDVDADVDIVKAAESLRLAADALARITGRGESGDVEEVLGVVFEKFCVGK